MRGMKERKKKKTDCILQHFAVAYLVCVFVCVPGLFNQEEKPELIDTISTSAKNLIMFSLVFT